MLECRFLCMNWVGMCSFALVVVCVQFDYYYSFPFVFSFVSFHHYEGTALWKIIKNVLHHVCFFLSILEGNDFLFLLQILEVLTSNLWMFLNLSLL